MDLVLPLKAGYSEWTPTRAIAASPSPFFFGMLKRTNLMKFFKIVNWWFLQDCAIHSQLFFGMYLIWFCQEWCSENQICPVIRWLLFIHGHLQEFSEGGGQSILNFPGDWERPPKDPGTHRPLKHSFWKLRVQAPPHRGQYMSPVSPVFYT